MMENGKRRKRRQLSPEEKWELFLEVTSQELSQADAAREWNVDAAACRAGRVEPRVSSDPRVAGSGLRCQRCPHAR